MDNPATTAESALAEIAGFENGTHPQFDAWQKGERAALDYRARLYQTAYPKTEGETQPGNEQRDDERQPESAAGDEYEQIKTAGVDQLKQDLGDAYEAHAAAAGRFVSVLVDSSDPVDAAIWEQLDGKLGNDPRFIAELSKRGLAFGDALASIPKVSVDNLTVQDKESLARTALTEFFEQGAPQVFDSIGQNENLLNFVAKIGLRLQRLHGGGLNKVTDNTRPQSSVKVDSSAPGARAAQDEIDNIRAGNHKLSESWRRGDEKARAYVNQLYQRITNGR
jgi:hypothetical protein